MQGSNWNLKEPEAKIWPAGYTSFLSFGSSARRRTNSLTFWDWLLWAVVGLDQAGILQANCDSRCAAVAAGLAQAGVSPHC
jgi:hypothetical protein